ncbi:J domain-containing protein [Halorubellus sp. PRR65]|uniref:J domain-containing protein n=1 Tax=Halorubellus sp. PRR65 TaxID=3098148 RepID=UPI002B25EAD9|nr:J domain-containing protein [Halorubellus sp. PRR65]
MRDSPLLFGLASVFAGLTTMLTVVAIVTKEAFVLAIALPFAATGYFMWYQATGRMRERVAEGVNAGGSRFAGRKAREGAQRGRSRFAREARRRINRERRREARAGGRRARASATAGGRGGARRGGPRVERQDGPSAEEAYRRLGLDPTADEDAVREAYRERVKEVHPDTADGDEEAFKRVTAAYERLTDE